MEKIEYIEDLFDEELDKQKKHSFIANTCIITIEPKDGSQRVSKLKVKRTKKRLSRLKWRNR